MELKESIIGATIGVFNQKGLKFTMDDIAKSLGMSKKTIYTVFSDKEELFLTMVDYIFNSIKESEQQIVEDDSLSTVEKLGKILGVMPECYKEVDFSKLYLLREKYPEIYKQVEIRLETGWESTIELIREGIDKGELRPINIPLFKMMMEASLEQFFQRDILIRNKITYADALNQVVEILMVGIIKQEE